MRGSARARLGLLVVTAVVILVPATAAVTGMSVPFRNDFAAYWPVAHLLLDGENPYDSAAIEEIQRSVDDDLGGDAVVRYPPWSLPLLVPLAFLPYAPGWYLWIVLQIVMVAAGSLWIWRLLGGRERSLFPLAIAFLFPPGLFVALGGQIDGLLLIGAAGFLWAMMNGKAGLAGASLGLLTMKPHLFLALGITALYWSVRGRQIRLVGAAVLVIATGSALALLFRPHIFPDYLDFLRSPSTDWTRVVAFGTGLSAALDGRLAWLKWIPALLVAMALVILGVRRRENSEIDWQREFPTLLVLGLLAAPYLLVHDLVLLLPALLACCLCARDPVTRAGQIAGVVLFLALCTYIWIGQVWENST
ncbi:MAG: glycosyltransferase family 87 protein, partial [Gemmatimonadota bacterium]